MRISALLAGLVVLAGCGGTPNPVVLCADGSCDRAFARVVSVNVSSPGGNFQVLRDGTNQRSSFGNGGQERGVTLSRDELAPLWVVLDDPSFHAELKSLRSNCTDFASRRCLQVTLEGSNWSSGCWCGPSGQAHVDAAWDEALAVFDRAFP